MSTETSQAFVEQAVEDNLREENSKLLLKLRETEEENRNVRGENDELRNFISANQLNDTETAQDPDYVAELEARVAQAEDPIITVFADLYGMANQPASNLVDLLDSKGPVERAAYIEHVRVVLKEIDARLDAAGIVKNKLEIAEQLL